MIGRIKIQDSFRFYITYCLEDKKIAQSQEVLYKDRAEVLHYNQCGGNRKELIRQFNEIAHLDPKLSKPLMHIVLVFSPKESLRKSTLTDIAKDCAKDMGFDKHQYLAILHKDLPHQHMHLLINKIGFDRQVVNESHSYRKVVNFCRATELKYDLVKTISPRCFLPAEQRNIPRQGIHLDQLRKDIHSALEYSSRYEQFRSLMEKAGYTVYDQRRGIAFMNSKKIAFQGYEAGYPLHKIKSILAVDLAERLRKDQNPQLSPGQEQQIDQSWRQRPRHRLSL